MNIISAVSRNHFLKDIYPNGLTKDVLIGDISFHPAGRFSLELHAKQIPAKEVLRWGVWGKEFNVVVICLEGRFVDSVEISDWEKVDFAPLICAAAEERYLVTSSGSDWKIEFRFHSLVFQNCKTYLLG